MCSAHRYRSQPYYACRNYTYESCLEYVRKYGTTVVMPPRTAAAYMPGDIVQPPAGRGNQAAYPEEGLYGRGLFHYRKWWERSEVDIFVNGNKLTGIPIFTDENTLRLVNDDYSYFVPIEKIDYIRTTDGLKSCSPSQTS